MKLKLLVSFFILPCCKVDEAYSQVVDWMSSDSYSSHGDTSDEFDNIFTTSQYSGTITINGNNTASYSIWDDAEKLSLSYLIKMKKIVLLLMIITFRAVGFGQTGF